MHEAKCVVITGAAQGIGRRSAEKFAQAGYRLALIDLRMPEETQQSAKVLGTEIIGRAGDITDEPMVERFAAEVRERWGVAHALANNAGISFIAPAESVSASDYRRVLEVNLVAPFLLAKAFGREMLAAKRGSIVNVASVAGLLGIADRAAYNASKHGLIGRTRTWPRNGAGAGYGSMPYVRVG